MTIPTKGTYTTEFAGTTHQLARDGGEFIVTNPTPGTALAYNVQASFSDTVPYAYIFNGEPVGGRSIELVSLKHIVTVAAASGVTARGCAILDNVARALGTDNTTALTASCANGNVAITQAPGTWKVQNNSTASAVAASSANKRVAANWAYGGVTIVGDELEVLFGALTGAGWNGLTAAQATCPGRKVTTAPAVIIPPQWSCVIHLWFASNAATGLSAEPTFRFVARASGDA